MRFELDADQQDFAAALDSLLTNADTVAVARAWADGDHGLGLRLWGRLAEMGVTSLADEPVFLALALERLGYHAVPGPWVESVAYLARTDGIATLALPPHVPFALDADVADEVYVGDALVSQVGEAVASVDRTRRLFRVSTDSTTEPGQTDEAAFDRAVLATAAQLLGAGERVLADSVTYVKQRRQFGREIGSYQAIKHALADVRIALDFARPLVLGAALGDVDVSAAKVAAGDAAYLASRTGLQVHGAIGYTQEFDLSLWLTKIRALVTAWGTPDFHRGRLLQQLGAS